MHSIAFVVDTLHLPNHSVRVWGRPIGYPFADDFAAAAEVAIDAPVFIMTHNATWPVCLIRACEKAYPKSKLRHDQLEQQKGTVDSALRCFGGTEHHNINNPRFQHSTCGAPGRTDAHGLRAVDHGIHCKPLKGKKGSTSCL